MTTSPRRLFDERCNAEDDTDDHDGSDDDKYTSSTRKTFIPELEQVSRGYLAAYARPQKGTWGNRIGLSKFFAKLK